MPRTPKSFAPDAVAPAAVILGLNEIASAVAVRLHRAGYRVVMSHDPSLPVIRCGMSFHDALFGDPAVVAGVSGVPAEHSMAVRRAMSCEDRIAVTHLALTELVVVGPLYVLVDARMLKKVVRPDLRNIARVTIGLGPGFEVGRNCDIAVETKPSETGNIVTAGRTEAADGMSRQLGGVGRERFVYSETSGRWRTALDVGKRVFKGFPLGYLGAQVISAPLDGILRGIARDDTDVLAGVKLIEIDVRGRASNWVGIDERGRASSRNRRPLRVCRRRARPWPACPCWRVEPDRSRCSSLRAR